MGKYKCFTFAIDKVKKHLSTFSLYFKLLGTDHRSSPPSIRSKSNGVNRQSFIPILRDAIPSLWHHNVSRHVQRLLVLWQCSHFGCKLRGHHVDKKR